MMTMFLSQSLLHSVFLAPFLNFCCGNTLIAADKSDLMLAFRTLARLQRVSKRYCSIINDCYSQILNIEGFFLRKSLHESQIQVLPLHYDSWSFPIKNTSTSLHTVNLATDLDQFCDDKPFVVVGLHLHLNNEDLRRFNSFFNSVNPSLIQELSIKCKSIHTVLTNLSHLSFPSLTKLRICSKRDQGSLPVYIPATFSTISTLEITFYSHCQIPSLDVSLLRNLSSLNIFGGDDFDLSGVNCLDQLKYVKFKSIKSVDSFHRNARIKQLRIEECGYYFIEKILEQILVLQNCLFTLTDSFKQHFDKFLLEIAPWIVENITSFKFTEILFPCYFMPLLEEIDIALESDEWTDRRSTVNLDKLPRLKKISGFFERQLFSFTASKFTSIRELDLKSFSSSKNQFDQLFEFSPLLCIVQIGRSYDNATKVAVLNIIPCSINHLNYLRISSLFTTLPVLIRLKTLAISRTNFVFDDFYNKFPNLFTLVLERVKVLADKMTPHHGLQVLTMQNCSITHVPQFLSYFPSLTVLKLTLKQFPSLMHFPSCLEYLEYDGPQDTIKESLLGTKCLLVTKSNP
ncbi:hypothetical protein RCL1_002728 [Eukaryota sp. TZLM3-RCL]